MLHPMDMQGFTGLMSVQIPILQQAAAKLEASDSEPVIPHHLEHCRGNNEQEHSKIIARMRSYSLPRRSLLNLCQRWICQPEATSRGPPPLGFLVSTRSAARCLCRFMRAALSDINNLASLLARIMLKYLLNPCDCVHFEQICCDLWTPEVATGLRKGHPLGTSSGDGDTQQQEAVNQTSR